MQSWDRKMTEDMTKINSKNTFFWHEPDLNESNFCLCCVCYSILILCGTSDSKPLVYARMFGLSELPSQKLHFILITKPRFLCGKLTASEADLAFCSRVNRHSPGTWWAFHFYQQRSCPLLLLMEIKQGTYCIFFKTWKDTRRKS